MCKHTLTLLFVSRNMECGIETMNMHITAVRNVVCESEIAEHLFGLEL